MTQMRGLRYSPPDLEQLPMSSEINPTINHATIKTCIDRTLPPELMFEAMRRAMAENPQNAPVFNPRTIPPGVIPDLSRVYLAGITGKLWQPGRILRVRFLDGDPEVQARIPAFARLWSDTANIGFEFGDELEAEIRISFQNQGSWSYIGTDALVIPANQPTMNFGWLNRATDNEEYARVVTHEFGHALGCIHEHQNPAADIPWNREVVYRYYQGPPNFWNREQVDLNLFTRYAADITQFSEFDPASIMLYPIPNEFTVGDFEVGWNSTLSPTDLTYISTLYPAERAATILLRVDAPPVDAYIGAHGQVDAYSFTLDQPATVRLETAGSTDVIMSLADQANPTRTLAMDDDSGSGRNARIVTALRPATYLVRIRHFNSRSTGGYRLGLYTHTTPGSTP
jgi:hypothetical protein